MLKKALKNQGIRAKVTKSGVSFEIPISGDFRGAKLPPIGVHSGKLLGNKEYIHCSASDVVLLDTEIKRTIYFRFSLTSHLQYVPISVDIN